MELLLDVLLICKFTNKNCILRKGSSFISIYFFPCFVHLRPIFIKVEFGIAHAPVWFATFITFRLQPHQQIQNKNRRC